LPGKNALARPQRHPIWLCEAQNAAFLRGLGKGASAMNGIIYLVGLVVVVAVILSFLGVF